MGFAAPAGESWARNPSPPRRRAHAGSGGWWEETRSRRRSHRGRWDPSLGRAALRPMRPLRALRALRASRGIFWCRRGSAGERQGGVAAALASGTGATGVTGVTGGTRGCRGHVGGKGRGAQQGGAHWVGGSMEQIGMSPFPLMNTPSPLSHSLKRQQSSPDLGGEGSGLISANNHLLHMARPGRMRTGCSVPPRPQQ